MLDYGVIQENLLVGSCPYGHRDLISIRKKLKASAILCLQDDLDLTMMGINYENMKEAGQKLELLMVRSQWTNSNGANHRLDNLRQAVKTLQQLLNEGHTVYVHCTLGQVRSPTVALAYLTGIQGFAIEEAIILIKQGRPQAMPLMRIHQAYQTELNRREHSS
ncbi:MAG TPA: dual specificity protein phosphatase family protein [Candidatus Competibacteraceae bacterium]|nr:dual specificity protein phosphatase family protein [Candidatus Competibacteraceae bacterium]HQA26025.1 dual specificity protein phosphatase family protein [Candidatus Competibacteraceae bacterium]HQD57098.1 dual specificity protein phosphatase family protein [Candidatus Competibacteraceae bacterium]